MVSEAWTVNPVDHRAHEACELFPLGWPTEGSRQAVWSHGRRVFNLDLGQHASSPCPSRKSSSPGRPLMEAEREPR